MPAPAEIPHADEALKTLVQRFKAAPGSAAFTDLAAALLARGHAAEALRITEHGLQLVPGSVEGRVQRAAALIAQGRPRMAYVELLRALAIEPHHRRAQRLLGKAFVDTGAPERAAALLAQRSGGESPARLPTPHPPSNLTAALVNDLTDDTPTTQAWKPDGSADLPALFSALTKDLGLGAAVPEAPAHRPVEVTQIIRRKARPRPPRSASELAEIEGPIVDTTHRPASMDPEDEPAPVVTARAPVPLFNINPDLASLALDDEPLFQEHMPFAVRPVNASEDLAGEPERGRPPTERPEGAAAGASHPSADLTREERTDPFIQDPATHLTPPRGALRSPPPKSTDLGGRPRPSRSVPPPVLAEAARPDGAAPVVERQRTRVSARLEVETPPANHRRWVLALVSALVMAAYFFGWVALFGDSLAVWWTAPGPEPATPERTSGR